MASCAFRADVEGVSQGRLLGPPLERRQGQGQGFPCRQECCLSRLPSLPWAAPLCASPTAMAKG